MELFRAATRSVIGEGNSTLVWEDRWICGCRIAEIVPRLYEHIPHRIRASRLISEALRDSAWARDIGPNIDLGLIREYLDLWQRFYDVDLLPGVPDNFSWAWERNGSFSVRSAYAAKFWGREVDPMAEFTWTSKAP